MILSSPVSSNMLGVIHGYTWMKQGACQCITRSKRTPQRKRTSSTSHPPRLTPRTFSVPYEKLGWNARAAGRRPARARRTADAADENISRSDYGEGMEWRRKKRPRTKHGRCWMDAMLYSHRKTGRSQNSSNRAIHESEGRPKDARTAEGMDACAVRRTHARESDRGLARMCLSACTSLAHLSFTKKASRLPFSSVGP